MSGAGADGDSRYSVYASSTVLEVYERLLEEIVTGRRSPGAPLRDRDIAIELGVSRTPVREAVQMLRQIGVVEASPSRYTRVARLGPQDVAESWSLGLALYGEIVREFAQADREIPITPMERSLRAAADELGHGDLRGFWLRLFEMHDQVMRRIVNPHLLRAVRSINYAFRVAVLSHPQLLDAGRMLRANREALDAIRDDLAELPSSTVADFVAMGEDLSRWRTVAP